MSKQLALFEGFGVELEYMIVDRETLDVQPVADQLLHSVAGEFTCEVELGDISWSNELALHVIELKTSQPAPQLNGLADRFAEHVGKINEHLSALGARLMPTAMHPWMDPDREMQLWPHEYNPVYEAYNRIFDCRGHGWANLQSVHLNLPFQGDEQFGRLHTAIRLLLPLLPALAASSPITNGRLTGITDNRMHVYRSNSRRVPQITGMVIPEPVTTRQQYDAQIFQPMYAAIAPLDVDGILCHEWLNSRGAIARFDRNAIEIRVLDIQEQPAADIAICEFIVAVLQRLVTELWTPQLQQLSLATEDLAGVLADTVRDGELAQVARPQYLKQFGIQASNMTARAVWQKLLEDVAAEISDPQPIEVILKHGTLARRIQHSLQNHESRARTRQTYARLCECLSTQTSFIP